jgi:tRNA A37 threonylcarbamoyltransferase TsaD
MEVWLPTHLSGMPSSYSAKKWATHSLAVPPPHLCTDNGIMIAWSGIERWRAHAGVTCYLNLVDIASK